MKIFTLLQNLLTMITGQTSRNLQFKSPKPKAQSLKPNLQSVKRKAESVKPNEFLIFTENVPQVNTTVQNAMAPKNDASVSFEYKILPVQKKITSVQNIKPVFMQNFFAIVKKIFSLSDHPETLIENLNDGYHPGCHYGTAGTENISGNNLHHDVANEAASFALIPIAITPTAMNQLEKQPVKKTITGRSGIFGIMMLMSSLFFVSTAMAQTTSLFLQNTNTQPGNGTFVRDMALAQGSAGTVTSSATTSGTSSQVLAFTITNSSLVNAISGNTFSVSVNVNNVSSTNSTARFRLLHQDNTGTTVTNGTTGFSATFNSNGVKTATLTFGTAQTWASSDRLVLSIELLSTTGGSRTLIVNTGSATSFVQYCTTPNLFNVTGGGSLCSGGPGAPVGLDGSQTGVSYQLVLNGTTNVGSAVTGTGSAINFPVQTTAGSYTVTANTSIGGCTSNMTGSAVVAVTPSPGITLSGNPAVCSGATTANLNYSASANSPDQYSITWNAAALTALFTNVVSQPLAAAPGTIVIAVPAGVAAGTYTGTLTVTNSTTTCSSTGTSFSVIVGGAAGGWLGTTSTDWFDGNNWCGGVPTSTTNVTIPAGTTFQPSIGGAGAVCNDITIASGASLTITGTNILTVSGNWTKLGTGTLVPNNSTVVFNSTTTQTVANGGSGNFFSASIGGTGTLQVLTNAFITSNSFNIAGGGTLDLNGIANPALGDLQGSGFITNSSATAVTLTEGSDNTNSTYSGVILAGTGAISLTKTGAGALTLSGANAYTGTTTLTSGTLNISNSSAIGTGALAINGGTIDNTSGSALTLSTNNAITIGGSFTFGGTNNLNLGTGAITNAGSRTITLNGTNSILTLGGTMTNTSGGNQTTTVSGAGNTLVLGGYALSNSGTSRNGTFAGTGNVIISGIVSNGSTATTSTLSYTGSGALTLSGANSYGGTTNLTTGTLNINNATALGTGGFTINSGTIDNTSGSDLTLTTNNAITFAGSFTFGGTSNLNFGTGAITNNNNRTITLNGAGTILTFGGTMTNSSGATQTTTVNGAGNNLVLGGYALSSSNTGRNGTFTGSGNVAISGAVSNGGTGAGSLTYSGAGMLTLNGNNSYTGATTLNSGTLNINTATAIGSGTFTIAGGTIDNTSGSAITLSTNNAQAWTGDFIFTGSNALNLGTGNVTIAAVHQVTINANTLTDGGNFSGAGGITKAGPGLLILTGNTNNTGATTITAGELRLNPSANSTSATPVTLNGGILGTTGITATRTITGSGTLMLATNSNINLDPVNAHSLIFAPSSSVAWTPGAVLTVNNWQGTAGSPGTVGKIFFGNTLNTLTASQLSQITFTGFPGIPIILVGTGEIVPQGAAPMLNITGTLNIGNACVGTPATQNYTITNTASTNADGITVVSDNPLFVVSNLSGTTALANSASPLTFQVTFTATAAGAQTANITVSSTTAGSNSPVAGLSANGLANPISSFTYNPGDPSTPASFCQAATTNPSPIPNPNPTFLGGGVAGTFSAAPAGLVFVSTTTGQVDLKQSAPGSYTVTNFVTGGNGCTSSSTASIIIKALPVATISYAQPAYCVTDAGPEPIIITNATGGIIGNFSSIPSGLIINSSTGAITPLGSTPGNYKVVYNFVGGPNNCPNTDTAFVTIAQTASGSISYPGSPFCTNSGIINVTSTLAGTTTGAQYSALPAGLIIDPNTGAVTTLGSTAGSYTVTVTIPSLGGCDPFTTNAPIAITDTPTATVSYGGSNLCSNAGTSAPVITGATGGTFTSTPAGLSIDPATGIITLGSSTVGTYTVTYKTPAVNGCFGSAKTNVTIQTSTTVPVLNTPTICTGTGTISIILNGESNGTPIQVIDNGSVVLTFTRTGTTANYTIPAGTFHNGDVIKITAQATGKCLSLASNSVTVGAPAQVGAITGSGTVCPNTTGNAYSVPTVTGVTYAWTYTPAAGVTITNGTTATPTLAFSGTAASGTLTVTASNTCGAGGTQSLPITVNPGAPTSSPGSITGLATVCSGTSQTYSIADVAGATNYTWTVPTGWTINSGQGNTSINVTAGTPGQNGNITVVASNSCGNAPNPASNAVSTALLTSGTGADVNGNSGGSVTWATPGNITTGGTPFATAAVTSSFTPSHYLIGSNYGFAIPSNATILGITVSINRNANNTTIRDNIVSLVKATNNVVGSNLASATAWPTVLTSATYGGTSNLWGVTWTPADINSTGFGAALSITNSTTFTNGTTATVDVIQISVTYAMPQSLPVTVSSGPTITLGANPVVSCNGATSVGLPYTGTTGNPDQYSITYDGTALGAGFSNVATTSLPASPITLALPASLAAGTYNGSITVSSSTGCTGLTSVPFTITVPSAITTGTSESDATCFGGSDGSATVTPVGGTGTLTVSWTGPNSFTRSGTSISGLVAGTYNYSITDINGCGPLTGSVVVGQAAQITAATSETDASCFGSSDGSATVTPSGGNGSYTILWTGPGTFTGSGFTISGLAAGTYNYTIADGNGCGPVAGSIVVGQSTPISATTQIVNACSDGTGGSVTINPTGGAGAPYFILSNGDGPTTINPGELTSLPAGDYDYLVFDNTNTCSGEIFFTVGTAAQITVTGITQNTLACNGDIATVTITATGGSAALTYIFDGVSNSTGVFTHTAGLGIPYTVTDANDCAPATGTFDVVQPAAVTVSNVAQSTILCNGGTATVTITAAGGTGALSYTFDGVTNSSGVFTHAAGTGLAYSVTDANGCTPATGTFDVVQPDVITVSNVGQSTILCNGGSATVTITALGGTLPLSYTFDGITNTTGTFTHVAGTGFAYSVTDANNCTAVNGVFDVVQPAAVTVNNISQSTILCNGGTATVTIVATGGTGLLSYTFDGVTNTTGIFAHAAGTDLAYSVTDANNCNPAAGTFDVLQPDVVSISSISQNTIACSGGTPTVTIVATGGTGTLAYTFDGVTNTTGIFPHAAGIGLAYSVTDANGCAPATGTFDVSQPAAVTVSNVAQSTILCNGGTATVTITASGGTGALSYTFDGVTNSTGIFTHAAGTGLAYSVTDGNGCTPATGTFDVVQPAIITVSNVGQSTILCNGGNATVTITAAGGTAPLSYTFDGVTNTTGNFTHAAGTGLAYSVTDANNCNAATGTFDVIQPAIVSVSNVAQSTIDCFGGNATVTITAAGGTGILSYTFDGVTNTSGIFTHAAGTALAYSVTDANNCSAATGTFDVVQPAHIFISQVATTLITCNGGTSTVTMTAAGGTGALLYTFDGVTNTTGIFTHGAGLALAYSVTDANNCTPASGSINILQPEAVTISNIAQSTIDCFGGSATVTITATGGTGTLSYTFDGVTNTTGIFTHGAGTGLAYSVTDASACAAASGTFNVVQPAAISVSGVAQSTINCNGGSATVTISATGGTAPLSYTFDGVTNTTGIFTHAAGNGLAYSVTDAKNCTPASGTFNVVQPAAVTASVSQGTIICSGGTTTVTITASGGTGALSYTFDGVTNSTGIFTHAAGTGLAYSVTDANLCTAATGTTDITQSAVLAATFTTNDITCFGLNNGTATITVTGGTPAYLYSVDGHTPVPGDNNNSKTFTGLFPGGHTVVITDNNGINGCSTSVTFTLNQPTQLAAIASAGTVSCNSSTTSLFVIASGGTAPYLYSLNGGPQQPGFVFTVGAGSYVVTVTDAKSCAVTTASVGVANPTQMTIAFSGVTPTSCTGSTGSFTITASGGAGSYSYSLNGGQFLSGGTFSGLAANTYLATAKDANGCTVSGNVTIAAGSAPQVFNVTGGGSSCTGAGFSVGLSNSEAGVTYFLLLNNTIIANMPPANILPGFAFSFGNQTGAGVYTVMASNPAGCISAMSGSATITSGTPPTAFNINGGGNYCSGPGLPIGLSGSQSGVSYQLLVNGTNTGSPVNGNGSSVSFGNQTAIGTYTVVATNTTSNCTNNMLTPVSITGGSLPTPFTVTADPDNCTGSGVHIRLAASQVNVNYQLWFNGAIDAAVAPVAGGNGTPIDFGLQPSGTYTVAGTTLAGCTANMTGSVTVNSSSLPVAYNITGGGSYCSGGLGLHVGLQNSESGVNYQLFNGATAVSGFFPGSTGSQIDFGLFQSGTYTVVARNATGCTNNMTGSVTIALTPAPATVTLIAPNGVNDCTGTGADIQISSSESGVSYQLSVNGIAMGSLIPGTGNPIDLGKKPSGTYTIVGTSNTGGCMGNTSNNITVNSGTAPIAYTVNGGGNYCSGPGLAIGLTNSETGVNYVLMLNGTTNVGFATGTNGNSVSFGTYTANGTYSVVATNTLTNCTANMLNSVSINAGSAPTAFNVTGSGSYCSGGIGVDVGLSSSENGINYQLMSGGNPSGAALVGNGSPLDFGFRTAGTYTVVATNTQAGCTSNMNGSAVITLNGAAVNIITQPLSQPVCITSSVTLSVNANNATGYQWYIGSSPIVDATTSQYTTGTPGSYTVVVSGICGAPVTSQPAVLTAAPVVAINTQPVGGAFCGSVQLSVSATGATGYQWFNGASSIGGANASTYTATASGSYTVVVSGNCGSPVTSNPAVLTATPVVAINTQPVGGAFCGSVQLSVSATGATGYQWFNGASSIGGANASTYTATASGSYTVVVSGNCGSPVTSNPAVLTATPGVTITTQPLTQSFCGSVQLSVSATGATGYQWFNGVSSIGGANASTYTATASGSYTVVVSGNCGSPVTSSPAVLTTPAPVSITTQPQSQTFTGSNLLSVVASNATGYQWYLGSNPISGANGTTYTATAAGTYKVVVSGMCSSQATSSDAVLSACPAVTINTQPLTQSFCGSVQLSVSASNATGYQWKKGTSNIIGANSQTYTATSAGSYTVVVSGNCGSPVTSNPAVLTVTPGVMINTQPQSQSFCGSVQLSVSASNASGYQWKKGGSNITGANNPTYTATTAGTYTVVVSAVCGSPVTSNPAVLTANASVAITTQPVNKSICSGGSASFSVTASNANGYQWFRGNNSITGATGSTYTTSTAGNYKVVVSGNCGNPVTSNTVSLSVSAGVTIVTQPVSTQICAGGTESFSVVATNATGYQWYRNSNLIIGATHAQYFTGTAGRYDCRVFDACGGSVMSDFAMLTINSPVAITSQPQSATVCAESSAIFSVTANNANGYQWYRNNNGIPNATHASYTATQAGNYKVVVTGGCGGPITSNTVTLSFFPVPPVAGINGTGTICVATTVRFTDATSGGTWSSSNTAVATVSATGFVRGVAAGTATIRYSISNGCATNTATRNITVNGVPAVQDITGSSSVCPGSTIQLSDGTPNGDWSSSNTSVATVNNNGRVRGIRNGSVTISYTVQNSCGMNSVSIPVAVNCSSFQKNSLGETGNSTDELTLNVTVGPNPSQSSFTLTAQSSVLDVPITISIFDMQNRLVDKHTAGVGEAVRFGDRFAAGMYIVQVTQGGLQKTVKVVKN